MKKARWKSVLAFVCTVVLCFSSLQGVYALEAEGTEMVSTEDSAEELQESDAAISDIVVKDGIIQKADGTVEYGSPDAEEYSAKEVTYKESQPVYFDREHFQQSAYAIAPLAEVSTTDITANIRKRAEWVDADTGEAKITLQYSSNSGEVVSTKDMNVILIHDKSGTMDVNYGYNLEKVQKGWGTPSVTRYYPILNSYAWSEDVDDIKKEGYVTYFDRINYRDSVSGTPGYNNGSLASEDMHYASPCLVESHYYLLIRDDEDSNITGFRMVHGNNLQDVHNTDLHHYQMLSSRDEAVAYLEAGRRVIKQSTGYYIDHNGRQQPITDENGLYFLDISEMHRYGSVWILSTCASSVCQMSDRLSLSQAFYTNLVDDILERNSYNKIAYVPFWGDVPNNGSWENLTGTTNNNGLVAATNSNPISYKSGVTKVNFTNNATTLKNQIDNNFTYRGTNWSRAFQNAIDMLNARSTEDKEKETLVIFLTDGVPQGYNGKLEDKLNPEINGVKQLNELKSIDGVKVYACGVGVNELDTTGLYDNVLAVDEKAVFARNENEFTILSSTILNRISEQYSISIEGINAFYTDRVNSTYFTIDTDALNADSTWKVIESASTSSSNLINGVPKEVYNLVTAKGTTVNKVYVNSTKRVYWYIGNMTNGDYTASGHEITFPVFYNYYFTSTGGSNISRDTNTEQKLTYYTTQNENRMNTVTISTPSLVFNRGTGKVTITKRLSGSYNFDTDQTYRFVYSTKRYATGSTIAVADILGEAYVTVPIGSTSSTTTVEGLSAGTYYFYEVDENNNMVSPTVASATITESAGITEKAYSATAPVIPWAVTTSDGASLINENNILTITATSKTVNFYNYYSKVNVNKVWNDSDSSYRPDKVTVNLLRNNVKIDSVELSESNNWTHTFENLDYKDPNNAAYTYTVSEEEVDGYAASISYSSTTYVKTATITNTLKISDLTVTKVIKTNEIIWEHGNPLFMAKVNGVGTDGVEYTFYHTFEFTKEYVTANAKNGEVSMSYTFDEIPISNNYKVEELKVSRYMLDVVSVDGVGTVLSKNNGNTGSYDKYASVDLVSQPTGTEVTLSNVKTTYQGLSHNAFIRNLIK